MRSVLIAPVLAVTVLVTAIVASAPAGADEQLACLTLQQQRAAISNGQAVTLATAIRSARGTIRGRTGREVVKARLCRDPQGLRYMLTLLARDGKVTHASVDATSGKLVDAR
jgi:uncharacterized membrane protein YkoI